MQRLFLPVLLLISPALSFAQCDKDVLLTSARTEYMTGIGVVQRVEDEQSMIEINKSQVIISPGNSNRKLVGTIQSTTCDWSTPYQEGKTVIKAVFEDPSRGQLHATLTTEGKAGAITFLMEMAEIPDKRIRVSVTSFKEVKKE